MGTLHLSFLFQEFSALEKWQKKSLTRVIFYPRFSYPDLHYLQRVEQDLAAKGIWWPLAVGHLHEEKLKPGHRTCFGLFWNEGLAW